MFIVDDIMLAAMAEAAAAEAAAAAATQAAAAQAGTTAAQAAAAEAAAQAAAQAAATQAATSQAGIMGAQAAGAGPTGVGILNQAAPAIDAATAVGGQGAGTAGVQQAMQSATQAAGGAPGGITGVPQAAGSTPLVPAGATPQPSIYSLSSPTAAPGSGPMQYQLSAPGTGVNEGLRLGTSGTQGISATSPGASSFGNLPPSEPSMFDKFSKFSKESPFMAGAAAYTTAYNLGMLDPRDTEMPAKRSYGPQLTLSKDFQASEATPDVYQPSYKTYAAGGVMAVGGTSSDVPEPRKVNNPMATVSSMAEGGMPGYARGGALSDSLEFYKQMAGGQPSKAAPDKGDVGIFQDTDPDTRRLDALSAAQVRQAKVNKRANMQMPGMRRPTPMGQLNLAPPGSKKQDSDVTEAAQGGIMQAGSSLGGYAAGGNPRLLKGPGDGMSDNIPAVIGRKQPARLADGEFVIPADVVSHLGNGSTEAGAKRLHEMMTRVRKVRTGNPKQGKQINPHKYMPK